MKNLSKLIIAPHADDEVLGCGGILDHNSHVIVCGMDESAITDPWTKTRPSRLERLIETEAVGEFYRCVYTILPNIVNHYTEPSLISSFEKLINQVQPDVICIPAYTYNQDHRTVYNAALVALRPHDINFFVKKVLIYEQVQDLQWSHNGMDFKPNYFVPIDIERKLHGYGLYKSQVRSFRSPDMVATLASTRGAQCNVPHAEAFQILRWVE
jgi:LmbE family N-acetylglucosaminyl deacetylase